MKLACLAVVAFLVVLAGPVAAQQFEEGALVRAIEIYALMAPLPGLKLTYEVVRDGEVSIRVQGRTPGLAAIMADPMHDALFQRLVRQISAGSSVVTRQAAERFYRFLVFGLAVQQDRQQHGAQGTAKRFGMAPEEVGEVRTRILDLFNGEPLPELPPGIRLQ